MDKSLSVSDQKLWNAYLETEYKIPELGLTIHAETQNPIIDQYLSTHHFETWCFISAWNPQSKLMDTAFNHKKQDELRQQLDQQGYSYWEGIGSGIDGTWSEDSFWVLDIPRAEALTLGAAFRQKAILFGLLGAKAEILFC